MPVPTCCQCLPCRSQGQGFWVECLLPASGLQVGELVRLAMYI